LAIARFSDFAISDLTTSNGSTVSAGLDRSCIEFENSQIRKIGNSRMSRPFPALDVHPTASAPADAEDLQGVVLAALDDSSVTAVQELPAGWRFFFSSADHRNAAVDILRRNWPEALALAPIDVADEDWARRSQENLGPVRVGKIRISPPWAVDHSGSSTGIDVIIQPSMGFGTGHHATTRLCVALLQQLDLAGRRVLDAGTGSGVLAIVAFRLGAEVVLAVDDDEDAVECARENLELNQVTSGIEFRRADFRSLSGVRFDVVTANLTGGLLLRGEDQLLQAVAPGGALILSGITADEESSVRGAFEPRVDLRARLDEDGWVGLRYEQKIDV
jgi:ribosomal protein L11 methyltransferase